MKLHSKRGVKAELQFLMPRYGLKPQWMEHYTTGFIVKALTPEIKPRLSVLLLIQGRRYMARRRCGLYGNSFLERYNLGVGFLIDVIGEKLRYTCKGTVEKIKR